MGLKVEIDNQSGFCNGVIRAVECAEKNLTAVTPLFSLGSIVHNNVELKRLEQLGLSVINLEEMKRMRGETVLIRAHGEPPATYEIARKNQIKLIDCTCPVVLKLQQRIKQTYERIKEEGGNGIIVIFGKENHAEVNGLLGQINQDGIIVDIEAVEPLRIKGMEKIDFSKEIYLFSQTTKDPQEYEMVGKSLEAHSKSRLHIFDTICRQVAGRHANLVNFAKGHDAIIFVSGRESSNGKVLYELCKGVNNNSFHIQSIEEIDKAWLEGCSNVGICGATSTPKWQLEEVAEYLSKE